MRKLMKGLVAAVAMVSLLGAGSALGEEAKVEAKKDIGNKEGQYLAAVKIKTADGAEFDTAKELASGTAAFVMISPTCSLCRKEINDLSEVAKDKKIYVVVAAPEKALPRFMKDYAAPFTVLSDSSYALMGAANFRVTPSTLIVTDGKIVKKFSQYEAGQAEEIAGML